MSLLSSSLTSNNHNLYFSKNELKQILNLYSRGVSRGDWKDYAINFKKNNAFFYIFKHSSANPAYILKKSFERKKGKVFYNLTLKNINKKYDNLDKLIFALNRENLKIIN